MESNNSDFNSGGPIGLDSSSDQRRGPVSPPGPGAGPGAADQPNHHHRVGSETQDGAGHNPGPRAARPRWPPGPPARARMSPFNGFSTDQRFNRLLSSTKQRTVTSYHTSVTVVSLRWFGNAGMACFMEAATETAVSIMKTTTSSLLLLSSLSPS